MQVNKCRSLIRTSDAKRWQKWAEARCRQYCPPSSHITPLFSNSGIQLAKAADLRISKLRERCPGAGENIPLAFQLVQKGHANQFRKSSEPYEVHPFSVAEIIADWGLGEVEVVGALCHDMIEDARIKGARVTKEFLQEKFGKRVARLVEGVTELGKEPEFEGEKPSPVEIFKKMLKYGSKDLAIILIKLADRLHNMRTLVYMDINKRRMKAWETLHVFGKIADMLGMWDLKRELEDLSFQYLEIEDDFQYTYDNIARRRWEIYVKNKGDVHEIVRSLQNKLDVTGLRIDIQVEVRSVYELYQRMEKRGVTLKDISPTDVWRINLIVPQKWHCYEVLGRVHDLFHPIQEEIHDFIADPMPNGHRFLHTYVQVPGFGRLLVQIRDWEMNEAYHHGILSEIKADKKWYKQGGAWIDVLWEYLRGEGVTQEAMYGIIDAVKSSIFVYTRDGDKMELPYGSTPLHFAAKIHSQLFMHAQGVLINGRLAALSQMLQDGDEIVIIKSKKPSASLEWMDWMGKTPWDSAALREFSKFLKRQDRADILRSALRYLDPKTAKYHLSANELFGTEFVRQCLIRAGFADVDDFVYKVGIGRVRADYFLDEIRSIFIEVQNDPAMMKRSFGVKIVGEDRPGLLNDITTKISKQGMNLAGGGFSKSHEEDGRVAEIKLAIEIMTGLVGGVQQLQIENIIRNTKGVQQILHLSQEETDRIVKGENGK